MIREPLDFDDDEEPGELIPEKTLYLGDSDIRPGDRVFFRYRHRLLPAGWIELAGIVTYILPGLTLTYIVKVMGATSISIWPDLFVNRCDIGKVFPQIREYEP